MSQPTESASEVAVIGLGKSGVSATKLLLWRGYRVYVSDTADTPVAQQAADELKKAGAHVTLGGHDLERIAKALFVVVSPGVPPDAPPLITARERGVEVISEIELALRHLPTTPYIAVTGTNGKTTTTALVGHILRGLGYIAADAGNIGTPLAEVVLQTPFPDWVALEVSSFQLHDTPSIAPDVGILTNLSPDHLDRYASAQEYYADKARLFTNAKPSSKWVINADNAESETLTRGIAGEHLYFSIGSSADAYYDRSSTQLIVLGAPLLSRAEFPLLGDHNIANALAASLAVMVAADRHRTPEAREAIAEALKTFRALPHRMEVVGEWNGIEWINDSKATNISSTFVAVSGMTRPTILLLGGRHKGEPYTGLADPIRAHVKRVIAYGEAADLVAGDLQTLVPVDRVSGRFEDIIRYTRSVAEAGDTILLSPACSSYDMFKNYEERGAQFRALAQQDA